MGKFQELKVWQRAKDLAVSMHKLTGEGPFGKDWALRDQIRRATVSIPSNIAEGDELGTDRQAIKFFYTAKGSAAEVLTQTIIAQEVGYLTQEQFYRTTEECLGISAMLTKLISARATRTARGPQHTAQGNEKNRGNK